jgi:hypothetical protein
MVCIKKEKQEPDSDQSQEEVTTFLSICSRYNCKHQRGYWIPKEIGQINPRCLICEHFEPIDLYEREG